MCSECPTLEAVNIQDIDAKKLLYYLRQQDPDLKAYVANGVGWDSDTITAIYIFSDCLTKVTVDGILCKIYPSSRVATGDCALTFCMPLKNVDTFDKDELKLITF